MKIYVILKEYIPLKIELQETGADGTVLNFENVHENFFTEESALKELKNLREVDSRNNTSWYTNYCMIEVEIAPVSLKVTF